ncbi:MAG: ketosteroid isomerase family protein [Cyanobacteria bacterium J06650_10]
MAVEQAVGQAVDQAAARELVEQYFDSFNRGDFAQTASLFASTGQLTPPFEGSVTGPDAIFSYLQKKAENMEAMPDQWTLYRADYGQGDEKPYAQISGQWLVEVAGKVKAIVFQVNVVWQFIVTQDVMTQHSEIESAKIKLVASPKELFSLRSAREIAVDEAGAEKVTAESGAITR